MAKKRSSGARPPEHPPVPADRRQELLGAAYQLIAEKGLEGLRTRDIAARAGVNISTLHYYFETKEALLVALVDYVREKFTAGHVQSDSEAERNQGHTLHAHLQNAWESFRSDPQLQVVLQELTVRAHRNASTRAAFRTLHQFWNLVLEEVLRSGVASGELRADLDPALTARALTSFIMGAILQLGVNAKAFDYRAVAEELERLLAPARG